MATVNHISSSLRQQISDCTYNLIRALKLSALEVDQKLLGFVRTRLINWSAESMTETLSDTISRLKNSISDESKMEQMTAQIGKYLGQILGTFAAGVKAVAAVFCVLTFQLELLFSLFYLKVDDTNPLDETGEDDGNLKSEVIMQPSANVVIENKAEEVSEFFNAENTVKVTSVTA